MIRKIDIPFENQMTGTQTVLGWLYLAVHVAALPLLLRLLLRFSPDPIDEATLNLIYYCVGIVFCLTVMLRFLRLGFDRLVENLRLCILTMALALMIDYALSGIAALVLLLIDGAVENPNNDAIMELAAENSGTVKAIAIFLAPIVEEILFRGVIFGSIRTRSRLITSGPMRWAAETPRCCSMRCSMSRSPSSWPGRMSAAGASGQTFSFTWASTHFHSTS